MASKTSDPDNSIEVPKKYFLLLIIVLVALVAFVVYRQINIRRKVEMADFYRDYVKSYELDESWTLTDDQLRRQKKIIDRFLIESGRHQITREELGRNSWTLLHMITTTVPDVITPEMREQFNAFLKLFTKFYPCKLCANYFMRTLRRVGEFKGETKTQLMDYMCKLHNRVNRRLRKRTYDCDLVPAHWGTCDCFSRNAINNIK